MSLLFINTMTDTFTPTNSFSTATWVWELCRLAKCDSIHPWVISSDSSEAPFDWRNLILVPAPRKPRGWLATKLNNQFRHQTGWVHPGQWNWCRRVVKTIRRNRLDRYPMVLSNDIELAVYLRRHFPHAFILHQAHGENGAREQFRGRFHDSVSVACAVSDCTRQWNEKYYGFAPGGMQTLLNGVDMNVFRPAETAAPGLPTINFHSRFDPNKGPDVLLKAAVKTAATTNRFRIQLVGRKFHWDTPPDDFDRELDSLCGQLMERGVEVERTGWLDRRQLPEVLQRAHIHVTSSRWAEPFGLTTLEAMACGLATVASATGGSPQVLQDAGLLFENGDVDGLSGHLTRLICDDPFRRRYAQLARQRAEELTWNDTWRRLKELVRFHS